MQEKKIKVGIVGISFGMEFVPIISGIQCRKRCGCGL